MPETTNSWYSSSRGDGSSYERAVKAKTIERDCGYVRVLTLLWKHRLVLLLSLIVSAAVATPFALRSQATYTSTAALFLPSADPVAGIVSSTSALSLELEGYAAQELREDVRSDAGTDAGKIVSVSAEVDQNENDIYRLTAQAQTAAMATTTIQLSATRLIDKADALLTDEFGRFRENTTEEILAVYREKRRVDNLIPGQEAQVDELVSQLEGLDENSPEAGPLEDELARRARPAEQLSATEAHPGAGTKESDQPARRGGRGGCRRTRGGAFGVGTHQSCSRHADPSCTARGGRGHGRAAGRRPAHAVARASGAPGQATGSGARY